LTVRRILTGAEPPEGGVKPTESTKPLPHTGKLMDRVSATSKKHFLRQEVTPNEARSEGRRRKRGRKKARWWWRKKASRRRAKSRKIRPPFALPFVNYFEGFYVLRGPAVDLRIAAACPGSVCGVWRGLLSLFEF
jgi:hypothetical protein